MPGTIAPFPKHMFFTNNGDPAAGYQLFTYAAGTSTKLSTFQDVDLLSANTNPIILDSSGRCTIFLPAASFKFVFAIPTDTDPPSAPVWTIDNVSAVPQTVVEQDITGVAGENIAAGQGVYLSAGDGGRTAGRFYLWDADLTYASTTAAVLGMAPAAILTGASGSIRLGGRVTGLSGLTAGVRYFVSATAGALTASILTNSRQVAVADSTTSVILDASLRVPNASATQNGLLTTGAQTIAGVKTFSSQPIGVRFRALCTADLVKNANTSFTDAAGLAFQIAANEEWSFEFVLRVSSDTTPDAKFTLTGPASPTAVWFGVVGSTPANNPPSVVAFGSAVTCGTGGSAQPDVILLKGRVLNGANAGTVQLQFAQQTSNATNSTLYGSIANGQSFVLAERHA